jgi:peptidyl-prolyl cis-trans isomerase A (cyclophilin A)
MKRWIFSLLMLCGAAVAAPVDDGLYATIQTTMGDVCFELYYTNVPRTVANFVGLAEGTRPWIDPRSTFVSNDPYYNGILFHRVITNFMIQCGSPGGTGTDGPGYTFEDEFDPALRHDRPGVVSMANSGPDSNGGQFFITVTSYPSLDDVHSVFGSVVEGMDAVLNIAAVAVDGNDRPLEDVVITNAFITRNGTQAQQFALTNQALPKVEALPISIDSTNGIGLAVETVDASWPIIYASTDLTNWTLGKEDYLPEAIGPWNLTATGQAHGYFHANRVVYTPNTNVPADITGRHIAATGDNKVYNVSVSDSSAGSFGTFVDHSGDEHPISYWDQYQYPYHLKLRFQSSGGGYWLDLHYASPTNGQCRVYAFDSFFGWQPVGTGAFSDLERSE